MPPIETPYDERIQRLRDRINKKPGPALQARLRLAKLRKKKYNYIQQNTPEDIPFSARAETTIAQAQRNLQATQADIAGRRLAAEQQYGFGADQSNPFSVARMLEQNYHNQRQATLNAMARQGQLYAGSLSNARAADRFNFERSLDEAQREYQAQLADLSRAELAAQLDFEQAQDEARLQALEDAINAPLPPAPKAPNFKKQIKRLQKRIRQRQRKRRRKNVQNIPYSGGVA